jgi:ketosteroid isomerase-like protein
MSDDRQMILNLLREQEAATARGDAAGVITSLADDAVLYSLPPPLETRGAEARDTGTVDL